MTQRMNVLALEAFHKVMDERNGSLAQMLTQMVGLNERRSEFHKLQQSHAAGLAHVSGRLQKIEGVLHHTATTLGGSSDEGEIIDSVMMEDNNAGFGDE